MHSTGCPVTMGLPRKTAIRLNINCALVFITCNQKRKKMYKPVAGMTTLKMATMLPYNPNYK